MSHACKIDRSRAPSSFEIACPCGVAFGVDVASCEVQRIRFKTGAPLACSDAVAAVERATGLKRWSFDHLMDPDFDVMTGKVRRRVAAAPAAVVIHPCDECGHAAHAAPCSKLVGGAACGCTRFSLPEASPEGSIPVARPEHACAIATTPSGVENRAKRGGADQVSRPLQSALTSPKGASDQGPKLVTDGGCSSEAVLVGVAIDPNDDQTTATGVRCLWNVMDMLVLGVHVRRSRELLARLAAAKERSQNTDTDQAIEVGGETWQVSAKGNRRYQFVMQNQVALLGVSKCREGASAPALRMQFRAETMNAWGLDKVWRWVEGIANAIHAEAVAEPPEGNEPVEPAKPPTMVVSRIDLAADFMGFPFETLEHEELLCRARRRGRYFKVDPDDLERVIFDSGRNRTGLTCGKGAMMARVYDKTREVLEQSGKTWLFASWATCACCGERQREHEGVLQGAEVVGYGACDRSGCAAFVQDETGFMEARPCLECEGTGKADRVTRCPECRNGVRKKKTCAACAQTGEKRQKKKCPTCKGKKTLCDRVVRIEMQIQRETLVEFVKGIQRTCPTCAGLGPRSFSRSCKTCKGAGEWNCLSCQGKGARRAGPCKRCEGTGKVPCRRCKGAGEFQLNRACRRCRDRGVSLSKPRPEELVDPQGRLVVEPTCANPTTKPGAARNVGEDLELDIDTLEGLKAALKAIWRYCVGGGQGVRPWLSWRKKTNNKQPSLWPLRDEWRVVQEGPDWGESRSSEDELVRLKRRRAKLKKLTPQTAGMVIAQGALLVDDGVEGGDTESPEWVWTKIFELGMSYLEHRAEKSPERGWRETLRRKRAECALWGLRGERERAAERARVLAGMELEEVA